MFTNVTWKGSSYAFKPVCDFTAKVEFVCFVGFGGFCLLVWFGLVCLLQVSPSLDFRVVAGSKEARYAFHTCLKSWQDMGRTRSPLGAVAACAYGSGWCEVCRWDSHWMSLLFCNGEISTSSSTISSLCNVIVILLEKVTTKVIALSSWLRKGSKIPITSEPGDLTMVLLCWDVLITLVGSW